MSWSKERYFKEIRAALKEQLKLTSEYTVPRLEKVVLNCTTGEAARDNKVLQSIVSELTVIAGQKPVITKAKKSIAGFKIHAGAKLGAMVTLRRDRMFEFIDRLIYVTLPKVRDFRGLPRSGCDGRGNYSLGIKEQIVFPEIEYDKVDKIRGLGVTVCTTAGDDAGALALLRALRFPIV